MKTKTKIAIGLAIITVTLVSAGILAIVTKPSNDVPTSTLLHPLEPIATSTPKPTETPEPTMIPIEYFDEKIKEFEEQLEREKALRQEYNDNIEALVRVCDAEASVCDENGRRAVIDTVLNRVSSGKFRSTVVGECYSGDFQYSKGNLKDIDDRIFGYAVEEYSKWINGRDLVLPSDYFYFWGNHGVDENGNPTEWRNYFYNDYELWENEKHITTEHAYVFEDDNI